MEKCLPKYSGVRGSTYFRYINEGVFNKIVKHIKVYIDDIIAKNDKKVLKDKCLYLAKYLVSNKSPPYYYLPERATWEKALKEWLSPHYNKLDILGGCPLIMNQNDLEILELKYKVHDFCEKRKSYLDELRQSQGNPMSESNYSSKCNSYNEWIEEEKKYFATKKKLFENCYDIKEAQKGRRKTCNIMDPNIFNKQSICRSPLQKESDRSLSQESKSLTEVEQKESESASMREDQKQKPVPHLQETETQPLSQHGELSTADKEIKKEPQTQSPIIFPPEASSIITDDNSEDPAQSTKAEVPEISKILPSPELQKTPESIASHTNPEVPGETHSFEIMTSSSRTYDITTSLPDSSISPKIPGYAFIWILKKKKIIKRRHIKLLRIIIPSLSKKKRELLTNIYLENTINDNEETMKRIKINEHNVNNNVHTSKQKKDKFKTIVEIHMEILEELRNDEWEKRKKEFLGLCIELFTKEKYITYPNFSSEEIIIENTKSINDIEKKKILWNKWIKEHKNISEKLNKTEWFNYLKNEWKKKKASIKNNDELKINFPNEIQKDSFSEKEKDLWRQWIAKKRKIIEQYLEQEWFEGMTQEFLNILNEDINEGTKNNISMLNTEELLKTDPYEELYNYMKK
ncbi:STP1 protein, partial [Plasmodium malariae]